MAKHPIRAEITDSKSVQGPWVRITVEDRGRYRPLVKAKFHDYELSMGEEEMRSLAIALL